MNKNSTVDKVSGLLTCYVPMKDRYAVDPLNRRFVTGVTMSGEIRQGLLVHETEEYGVVVGIENTYICSSYANINRDSLFGNVEKLAVLLGV